jgi:hypothetical protein
LILLTNVYLTYETLGSTKPMERTNSTATVDPSTEQTTAENPKTALLILGSRSPLRVTILPPAFSLFMIAVSSSAEGNFSDSGITLVLMIRSGTRSYITDCRKFDCHCIGLLRGGSYFGRGLPGQMELYLYLGINADSFCPGSKDLAVSEPSGRADRPELRADPGGPMMLNRNYLRRFVPPFPLNGTTSDQLYRQKK